jgi:hypothetical protein
VVSVVFCSGEPINDDFTPPVAHILLFVLGNGMDSLLAGAAYDSCSN